MRFQFGAAAAAAVAIMVAMPASAEEFRQRQHRPGEQDMELAAACQILYRKNIKLPAECTAFIPTSSASATVATPGRPAPVARALPVEASPLAPPSPAPPPRSTLAGNVGELGAPFWMLRQDQYDEISYVFPTEGYQVIQGASVSYSDDLKAKSQTATTKGFVGYSVYNWEALKAETSCGRTADGNGFLARYGYGPFLQADGNYTQPFATSERSALRAGINSDTYFCNTLAIPQQDFQFLPYVQSDFRGRAGISGFDALWEPFDQYIHLGERLDVLTPKLVGYYFRILGEANVFRVGDPGLTNFQAHTSYALLGGTGEVRAVLFENDPSVGPLLCGTISFIGSAKYLWDTISQKSIYNLGAEVDYRLGGKSASTAHCPNASTANGSTSISLSYNQGTDPMTYVTQNVYKASLKFSY